MYGDFDLRPLFYLAIIGLAALVLGTIDLAWLLIDHVVTWS